MNLPLSLFLFFSNGKGEDEATVHPQKKNSDVIKKKIYSTNEAALGIFPARQTNTHTRISARRNNLTRTKKEKARSTPKGPFLLPSRVLPLESRSCAIALTAERVHAHRERHDSHTLIVVVVSHM